MTTAEALEHSYPNQGFEEELCARLSLQEIPEHPLVTIDHETSISGATVQWHLTRPEDTLTIKDVRPIVVENGLCGSDEAYRSLAECLANLGYIVLTKTPPRHQRADVAYTPHNLTHPMELQAKATWAVLRDYMRRYPLDDRAVTQQFHLVCHSMGGPVGLDVAEHHLPHIASATLIGSAGLEEHNLPTMAKRLGTVLAKEIAPAVVLPGRITNTRLAFASLKHIMSVSNRTLREAVQVSSTRTVPSLMRLSHQSLELYNIQPENDHFFPFAKQLGSVALFKRFVRFNVGRADHLIPQTQAALVAALIDNFVTPPEATLPAAA